ncbi:MAG: XTP/dITP diphosphatase [Thermodesulfobacteriota bacterium]
MQDLSQPVLVVATRNPGKAREVRELLSGNGIAVKGLSDFPEFPDPEETGHSFEENAFLKAQLTARTLGACVLSDDSGLVVEALDGAPGVYSARFGGPALSDADRSRLLLKVMEGEKNRRAAFWCCLCLCAPGGEAMTYRGRVEGVIAREAKGENGFGYDPVFYYPSARKTFAQMTAEEKNAVSHRGQALALFAADREEVRALLARNASGREKAQPQT